jgi:hypothetical protein
MLCCIVFQMAVFHYKEKENGTQNLQQITSVPCIASHNNMKESNIACNLIVLLVFSFVNSNRDLA